MSKIAYGIECTVLFDSTDKEHQHRSSTIFTSPAGLKRLPGAFAVILDKVRSMSVVFLELNVVKIQGIQVYETTEFRSTFFLQANDHTSLDHIRGELKCYKGSSEDPQWLDVNTGEFIPRADTASA